MSIRRSEAFQAYVVDCYQGTEERDLTITRRGIATVQRMLVRWFRWQEGDRVLEGNAAGFALHCCGKLGLKVRSSEIHSVLRHYGDPVVREKSYSGAGTHVRTEVPRVEDATA